MIEQTRELYKGYRGYKIRIGLISSEMVTAEISCGLIILEMNLGVCEYC